MFGAWQHGCQWVSNFRSCLAHAGLPLNPPAASRHRARKLKFRNYKGKNVRCLQASPLSLPLRTPIMLGCAGSNSSCFRR